MPTVIEGREVAAALQECSSHTRQINERCWQLSLCNGNSYSVSACLDNGWVSMRSPLDQPPHTAERLWRLCTHDAPVLVRFAMARDSRVELRADLPLSFLKPAELRENIMVVCRSFASARHFAAEKSHAVVADTAQSPSMTVVHSNRKKPCVDGSLAEWTTMTTWPHHSTSTGGHSVDMRGACGLYHRAALEPEDNDTVRLSVALGSLEQVPAISREAIAVWILRINAHTRIVRAAALEEGDSSSLAFEAILEAPSPQLIEATLCALHSACTAWGKGEPLALADPQAAKLFLVAAGGQAAFGRRELPQDGTGKEEIR